MKSGIRYIILLLFSFAFILSSAQVDDILKPVEINPPRPPSPQIKKESDVQLAAQFFRNREFDKAVVLYEKLYTEKNSVAYYTYYLYCLVELEDYKKAEKVVKKQIKDFPTRTKYLVDLGYVYAESGDQAKAKKQFENAIKNMPTQKGSVVELSNAFFYRGQTDYAVEVFETAGKMMKYPFYLELANLYRQFGNYSKMIDAYLNYVDYDFMNMQLVQAQLQNALKDDPDNTKSEYLRVGLLTRIQKSPQKIYFSEMLLWLSIQKKDFDMALTQAKSIDRRQSEEGERLFDLAGICLANESYDVAIDAYNTILKKGEDNYLYIDARIGLLYAHYQKITSLVEPGDDDLIVLEKEYESALEEYGKNESTIIIMQYLGHLEAFYLHNIEKAIEILNEAIVIPRASAQNVAACKIELADILLLADDVWESKLLYAQVEKTFKNDPIGYEAKFKNAKLSFYIGEYDWAKAQLDVLKAATTKLIANDALRLAVLISDNIAMDSSTVALGMYAKADLLHYRRMDDEALATLDSIFDLADWHPIFDEVLLKKAEIQIERQNYEIASDLLKQVVKDYPDDITADNALFLLAGLYENQFHDSDQAMEYYQQLLQDYPASLFTVDARKRFRILRGDFDKETLTEEEKFLFNLETN